MIVYICMTALSCAAAFMAQRKTGRQKLLWAVLSALPLVLVSALRWNIGTDYFFSFAPEYEAIKWHLSGRPEEVGLLTNVINAQIHYTHAFHVPWLFIGMERALIWLGADVQWLFVVCSVFIAGCICTAIYRQSDFPAFALFLFVFSSNFFLSLNIMRQYMAIALCVLAFEPAQKRRPVPFLLLVLLAAQFHPSALVFLPVYFLYGIKVKPLHAVILVGTALLAAPLTRLVLERAVPVLLPKYAWYFDSQFDAGEFETIFLLLNLAVLALAAYYYNIGKDKAYFRLLYNANLLGTLFLCFSAVVPLMKRINFYYAASHFLLIPLLVPLEYSGRPVPEKQP